MPFRTDPDLPLRPQRQLAKFLHPGMIDRCCIRKRQAGRVENSGFGAQRLQETLSFLRQKPIIGPLAQGTIEEKDAGRACVEKDFDSFAGSIGWKLPPSTFGLSCTRLPFRQDNLAILLGELVHGSVEQFQHHFARAAEPCALGCHDNRPVHKDWMFTDEIQ